MPKPLAMIIRPFVLVDQRLPKGWIDMFVQLGFFFLAYQGYQLVRGIADGRAEIAFANADRIVQAERMVGLFFEPNLQRLLIDNAWLIDAANWLYVNSHFVVTTSFLVWLYLFRNQYFYFVRNMFMVAMGLALAGYALFPTAPPRMLPEEGFVDTIATFTTIDQDSNSVSALVNKYAAVPSMHIGFALMVAGTLVAVARNRIARVGWALYPLLVFFVVLVTGNHYWFDALAGMLVAGGSALIAATVLARVRPEHWGLRTRAAPEAAA